MNIKAIIGAGLGDEGKGRLVDQFATVDSIVVRFNGGAQAGHTVVLPDGQRHVFHHIGAGSLKSATTYLSKFFIVNPILFMREYMDFTDTFGKTPDIYVNPHCFVTTPWDMIINSALNAVQGEHSTCGCGINETVNRSHNSFLLNVQLLKTAIGRQMIEHIFNVHVSARLKELGLEALDETHHKWITSPKVLNNFLEDVQSFLKRVKVGDPDFQRYSNVIFEGAQGLMLDQNHENFPYVTRGNTGVQNVGNILEDFHVHDTPEIIYVTRSYATRHGDGPFPNERDAMSFVDETNQPNQFQGKLRFGLLDVNKIVLEISCDMEKIRMDFNPSIAVTCLDQYAPHCIIDGREEYFSHEEFCKHILADRLHFSTAYASMSPVSGKDFKEWRRSSTRMGKLSLSK